MDEEQRPVRITVYEQEGDIRSVVDIVETPLSDDPKKDWAKFQKQIKRLFMESAGCGNLDAHIDFGSN